MVFRVEYLFSCERRQNPQLIFGSPKGGRETSEQESIEPPIDVGKLKGAHLFEVFVFRPSIGVGQPESLLHKE